MASYDESVRQWLAEQAQRRAMGVAPAAAAPTAAPVMEATPGYGARAWNALTQPRSIWGGMKNVLTARVPSGPIGRFGLTGIGMAPYVAGAIASKWAGGDIAAGLDNETLGTAIGEGYARRAPTWMGGLSKEAIAAGDELGASNMGGVLDNIPVVPRPLVAPAARGVVSQPAAPQVAPSVVSQPAMIQPTAAPVAPAAPGVVQGRREGEVEVIRGMKRSIFNPDTQTERAVVDIPEGTTPMMRNLIELSARGVNIPPQVAAEAIQQQGAGARTTEELAGRIAERKMMEAGQDRRQASSQAQLPSEVRSIKEIMKDPELRAFYKEIKGDRSGRTTLDEGDIVKMYGEARLAHSRDPMVVKDPGSLADFRALIMAPRGSAAPKGKKGEVRTFPDGRKFENVDGGTTWKPVKGFAFGGLVTGADYSGLNRNAMYDEEWLSGPGAMEQAVGNNASLLATSKAESAADMVVRAMYNKDPMTGMLAAQKMRDKVLRKAQGAGVTGLMPGFDIGYAQGGMVHGPGTGMSDSIPARVDGGEEVALSNGEYIMPADVVKKMGPGVLDHMVKMVRAK